MNRPSLPHSLLILSVLLMAACAQKPSRIAVENSQSDCPLALDVGQKIEINLPSNPSTGFRWELIRPASTVLHSLGPELYTNPEDAGIVGAAGRSSWRFQAYQSGEGELLLQYRRPWEQGVEPANTFACVISVD